MTRTHDGASRAAVPGREDDALSAQQALGKQLAVLRRRAGFTQEKLARLIGYSRPSVGDAENARYPMAREFWFRCDEVLKAGGRLIADYDRMTAKLAADAVLRHAAGAMGGLVPEGAPDRDMPAVAVYCCPNCQQPLTVTTMTTTMVTAYPAQAG